MVVGAADLTGSAVARASVLSSNGMWQVQLQFTPAGAAAFDAVAAERNPYYSAQQSPDVRDLEAIVVDGTVVAAPTIESSSFNGQAVIAGDYTQAECARIAAAFNAAR